MIRVFQYDWMATNYLHFGDIQENLKSKNLTHMKTIC